MRQTPTLQAAELNEAGFAVVRVVTGEMFLDEWLIAVEDLLAEEAGDAAYGVRGLLARSERCRALAAQPGLLDLARGVLGSKAHAVKGIFFDKNPAANWLVPWHQDLTITVRERRETPGFGPWSVKDGLLHVQPPVAIMESIIALRVHLDDAGPDNGALRVLPGTHRQGRIPGAEIPRLAREITPVVCPAARGDVLVMRPLLLHSSPISAAPRHRRVIHLEYTAENLPGGLEWGG
jgi:ectoine hydroxylase-related dioxygenase (phytanoyl-CoA dioxygenase family)